MFWHNILSNAQILADKRGTKRPVMLEMSRFK